MISSRSSDASTDRFRLTYFDPPAGLEKYVLTLFHFEWDEAKIVDRHPGALGQLFLTPRGVGTIQLGDQTYPIGGCANMFSAFEVAAPFELQGPWHSIGASLSPLGWAALTGVPANTSLNRLLPAQEILGADIDRFAAALNERYRQGEVSGEEVCHALSNWIAPRLKLVPPGHEALIERTLAWLGSSLNPDVEQLFARGEYSRRQVERLVVALFRFFTGGTGPQNARGSGGQSSRPAASYR